METETATNTEKSVIGTSSNGNFQDALQNAISKLEEPEMDKLIKWKLEEVYGEWEGFPGNKNIFVKIKKVE